MIAATRADAARLDAADPLGALRGEFHVPDGVIYLDGNSLGAAPKRALARLHQVAAQEWAERLIRSWNEAGWIDLPKTCGAKIASLIGVDADEVLVADSVSVNIFKLAAALGGAGAIAVDADEFPTDGYVLEGLTALTGRALVRLAPHEPLPEHVTVLIKSLVHYRSGAVVDVAATERAAAATGAAIIWDLSHAAGLIDVALARDGARYAVGCGYKFLNGGPGAPAFVYVSRGAANGMSQPIRGWMGHAAPFDFAVDYQPADGVARFAAGTPPVLSLSALDAALEVFDGVAMNAVEAKARTLGDLFLERALRLGLETISPPIGARRGGHVSLVHENGYAVVQALIARGVIGDFRAPNIMRFGFSPLYLTFAEVYDAADMLADILDTEEWRDEKYHRRGAVT